MFPKLSATLRRDLNHRTKTGDALKARLNRRAPPTTPTIGKRKSKIAVRFRNEGMLDKGALPRTAWASNRNETVTRELEGNVRQSPCRNSRELNDLPMSTHNRLRDAQLTLGASIRKHGKPGNRLCSSPSHLSDNREKQPREALPRLNALLPLPLGKPGEYRNIIIDQSIAALRTSAEISNERGQKPLMGSYARASSSVPLHDKPCRSYCYHRYAPSPIPDRKTSRCFEELRSKPVPRRTSCHSWVGAALNAWNTRAPACHTCPLAPCNPRE